jgi:hypothetical protein
MNTQDIVESWMKRAGLAETALIGHEQRCCFRADGTLEASIEWPNASDDLFVVVKLMPAQSGELRRKRLEEAMRLNAYALATRGAVIGWDEVQDQLVLAYRMDKQWLDAERLGRAVLNLCDLAQEVTQMLRFGREEALAHQVQQQGAHWFQPIQV